MGARRRTASLVAVSAMLAATLGGPTVLVPASGVTTDESYWVSVDGKLGMDGHGYGHGHGMSQHGAQGAALQGLSYRQIAEFYYPGTSWGTVRGRVRVLITADTSDDVVVSPTAGLSVRDLGDGSTHALPVNDAVTRWRIVVRDGRSVVQRLTDQWRRLRATWVDQLTGDAEFFADGPIKLWTPYGARAYRGALRSASPRRGSSARDTVNVLWMDDYVQGVVPYEMPASWHTEAVRAQAVAARTYATWSRAQNRERYYQICDTTACQVYHGTSGEDYRSNAAVRATARQVLRYQDRPAFTQFSASSGGWTSAGSMPYLPAKRDPYDGWSGNPVHSWSRTVDTDVLERRYPSIGTLRRILVTSRDGNGDWGGRVGSLVLDGTSGDVTVSGDTLRWVYGLRSTWFTFEPTAIIRRWLRIGGEDSRIGAVRSREYVVQGGAAQNFEHGRIYHSSSTGARELFGRVLRTYRDLGGPESVLRLPTTPVRVRTKGHFARFQNGTVFAADLRAPTVARGAIDERYWAEGGVKSGLGWATSSNYEVTGGQRVDYEHGYIRWVRETRTTQVVRTG